MSVSHARRKSKGSAAERALIHQFWALGWAAMRVAGSGSSQFPSPDLLVGNGKRYIALEVKATKDKKKYFPEQEIVGLEFFSSKFGAEPWVFIKFDRLDSFFVRTSDLTRTSASFVASLELCQEKGLTFERFIEL